jgi:hypothetical protein
LLRGAGSCSLDPNPTADVRMDDVDAYQAAFPSGFNNKEIAWACMRWCRPVSRQPNACMRLWSIHVVVVDD